MGVFIKYRTIELFYRKFHKKMSNILISVRNNKKLSTINTQKSEKTIAIMKISA